MAQKRCKEKLEKLQHLLMILVCQLWIFLFVVIYFVQYFIEYRFATIVSDHLPAIDAPPPIIEPEESSSHVDIDNSSSPVLTLPVPCELKFSSFSSPTTLSSDEHRLINNIDVLITEVCHLAWSGWLVVFKQSCSVASCQELDASFLGKIMLYILVRTLKLEILLIVDHNT